MAASVDYMFAFDATTNLVQDFMYEGIAESYLLDPENRKFIEEKNPWALRDMTERLLEAIQRKMWSEPSNEVRRKLEDLLIASEGVLEEDM